MKKKKKVKLKPYIAPRCEVIPLEIESFLLADSEIRLPPGAGNPPMQVDPNKEETEELEFG